MLRDQNLLSNSLAQRRQARWNCCVFGWDVQTRGWLSGSATTFLGTGSSQTPSARAVSFFKVSDTYGSGQEGYGAYLDIGVLLGDENLCEISETSRAI